MSPDLLALLQDPARAQEITPEGIPALLGELEQLRVILWTRMMKPYVGVNGQPPDAPAEDRLLTPEDTARRLGVEVSWLYRNQRRLPFARKLSRKCLRFSETGLRRWQAAKKA